MSERERRDFQLKFEMVGLNLPRFCSSVTQIKGKGKSSTEQRRVLLRRMVSTVLGTGDRDTLTSHVCCEIYKVYRFTHMRWFETLKWRE